MAARLEHGAARRSASSSRRRSSPFPLAWLVTRTDLPARRVWAAAAALPLVIPSYVAAFCLLGFFGPRASSPTRSASSSSRTSRATGERSPRSRSPPIRTCSCSRRRRSAASTRRSRRPRAGSASPARRIFVRVTAPALRPAVGLGALLVVLYTFSDFGVVSLMDYDTLTRAIYVQYKSLFDRAPAATLALLLVALTAIALVVEYRTRQRGRLYRSGPGCRAAAAGRAARSLDGPRARVLRGGRRALPRPPRRRARLLARPRDRERARARRAVERGAPLARGVRARGGRRRARALPIAVLALRYPSARRARSNGSRTRETPCRASSSRSRSSSSRPATRRPCTRPSRCSSSRTSSASSRRRLSGIESALERVSPRYEEAARGLGRGAAADARSRHRPARPLRRARGCGARLPLRDEGAPCDDPPPSHRLRHARDGDLEAHPGRRVLASGRPRARPDRRLGPDRSTSSPPPTASSRAARLAR